jgi:hypothetical protein
MKTVICIDDKNLPSGAKITEGQEYTVVEEYLNNLDQRVYILQEAPNEGVTKWGMRWVGYNSRRFAIMGSLEVEEKEHMFALN